MSSKDRKVAFITGGSKGIGLGIAESLIKDNYNVAITGRNSSDLESAVHRLNGINDGAAIGIASDVRSLQSMTDAILHVRSHWSSIDVLVANAGVGHFADIEEMTETQWLETIEINLTGVFNTIKAGLDSLKESKGYFITIASLAGTNFFAKGSAYNASKFGLVGFTQAVMLDLRKYNIKTTTIMPGSVATHFNGHTPSDADAWKIQPEDIGQMVVDLLHMNPRTLPSKIEVRPTIPPGLK